MFGEVNENESRPDDVSSHRPEMKRRTAIDLCLALHPISGVLGGLFRLPPLHERRSREAGESQRGFASPTRDENDALRSIPVSLSIRSRGYWGAEPPNRDRVECKSGSRSEPVFCTDRGRTRVSAYCLFQTRTLRKLERVFIAVPTRLRPHPVATKAVVCQRGRRLVSARDRVPHWW